MPMMTATDGTELHYEIAGKGETLVLVHGSLSILDFWQFSVPALADRFRVVSYERRGHGLSGGAPTGGTIHDDVSDLADVITQLTPGSANVAAASMGGTVALQLITEHPELVRRVAVHEPAPHGVLRDAPDHADLYLMTERLTERVQGMLEAGSSREAVTTFSDEIAFGPGAWELIPPADQDSMIAHAPTFLGELKDPDAWQVDVDRLRRSDVPLLLSQGALSMPIFGAIIEVLSAALPGAVHHTFDGAGHVPPISHPKEYVEAVSDFLAR